eukprot:4374521-Pleurochrysis_carterae.AAC.4
MRKRGEHGDAEGQGRDDRRKDEERPLENMRRKTGEKETGFGPCFVHRLKQACIAPLNWPSDEHRENIAARAQHLRITVLLLRCGRTRWP